VDALAETCFSTKEGRKPIADLTVQDTSFVESHNVLIAASLRRDAIYALRMANVAALVRTMLLRHNAATVKELPRRERNRIVRKLAARP
jgi:hypothetical protein